MRAADRNVGEVTQTIRQFGNVMALLIGLLVASLLGGVVVVYQTHQLSGSLRQLQSDNLTWRAAQLNVEHQALLISIQRAEMETAAAGGHPSDAAWHDISVAFDIYYSRLTDFEDLTYRIEKLHNHATTLVGLSRELTVGRDQMAAILDDPAARSSDDLANLHALAEGQAGHVRTVVVTALHQINLQIMDQHTAWDSLSRLARKSGVVLIVVFLTTLGLTAFAARRFRTTAARLDETRSRLVTVVGSSPEAILYFDVSGQLLGCNDAASYLTGYEESEFPRLSEIDQIASRRLLRQFLSGGDHTNPERLMREAEGKWLRTVIRHKSGQVFQIEFTVAINERQKELIAVVFAHAISDRLREARRIRRSRSDAIQLAQTRDRFLSEMSHEMRTPLHGVIAALDLTGAHPLPPEVTRLTEVARSSARAAIDQIDGVLDDARRRHGKGESTMGSFVPAARASNIVEDVQLLARMRGNDITLTLGRGSYGSGKGNARLFHRALSNLVSNACKFTRNGEIAVRITDPAPGVLRVEVEDTGRGIDAAALPHIFGDYESGDAEGWDGKGGSGLGLPIFAAAVKNMNGQFGVHSIQDEGTLFWFEIPFVAEAVLPSLQPALPKPTESPNLPAGPLNVLVVDDNEINRELLSRMLVRLNHHPVTAADGAAALALAARRRFDLVLTDIRMEGMDGYQTAAAIRAGGESQDAVIIGVTAHLSQSQADQAAAAAVGMVSVLVKPVTTADIGRAILLRTAVDSEPPGPSAPLVDHGTASFARAAHGDAGFEALVAATLDTVVKLAREVAAPGEPCETLADRVHREIGTCAVLGLTGLADSMRRFETALRSPDVGHHAMPAAAVIAAAKAVGDALPWA